MKTRTLVNWATALACVILGGIAWHWRHERIAALEFDRREEHTQVVVLQLEELLTGLKDVETGQRGFLITGVPNYLEPYNEALGSVERHLASLKTLTQDNPRQQERLNIVEPLIRAKLAELRQTIDVRTAQGLEPAREVVLTGRGKTLMDQIRSLVGEAKAEEARLLRERTAAKDVSFVQSFHSAILGGSLSGLLLFAAFLLLKREIRVRSRVEEELRKHQERLEEIVEERTGEISRQNVSLQQQSEEMARQNEELQGQAEELEQQSEELQSQTEELRATNQELDHREAMLQTILASLHGAGEERQVLSQVCHALIQLVGESAAAAGVVEKVGEELVVRASVGIEKPRQERWSFASSFASLVMAEKKTAFIEDLATRPDLVVPEPQGGKFRSLVATPLQVQGRPIGALEVYSLSQHQWTKNEFRIVEWAGIQCSRALEMVRLQQEVRESEELLRLAAEGVDLGIWDLDPRTSNAKRTLRHDQIFGYQELQPLWNLDIALQHVLPEDRAIAVASHAEAEKTGHLFHEVRVRWPDGTIHWVAARGRMRFDEQGGPARIAGVIMDVTERKETEIALARERAFVEAVLQACPAGIIVAEPGGKLVRMNPANQRLWGLAPFSQSLEEYREWKGWWADGSERHGRRVEPEEWAMARALQGQVCPGDIVEIEPFGAPGTRRTMINSGAPVRGTSGEVLGAVVAQVDITARKQAEEQLARMSRIMAEGQRIAHLGSFEYVAASRATIWSEEEYRIYGLDPTGPSPTYEAMLNKHIHREDAKLLHETFAAAMLNGSVYELEHRIVRPDGSVRFVYDRAHPSFDENGTLVCYVGATLDITERKQAAQALHASEQQYRLLFAAHPNPMWVFDEETLRFLAVNEGAVKYYGWSEDEFLAMTVLDVRPAPLRDEARRIIQRNHGAEVTQIGTIEHIRKDGTAILVDISACSIHFNGRPARLCSLVDVTNRIQAETALRVSERKHRTLFEGSRDAIMSLDPETNRWTSGNLAAVKMFGAANEADLINQSPTDFSPKRQPDNRLSAEKASEINEAVMVKGSQFFEWLHRRLNGEEFFADVLLTRIEWEGKPVIMATVRDITERKKTELALQTEAERLSSVLRAQREIGKANLNFSALLQLILERMSDLSGAEGACLEIVDGDDMVYQATTGLASKFVGLRVKIAGSLSGLCMRGGVVMRANDSETDPRVDQAACRRIGLRSMILAPLRDDKQSLGVLKLMSSRVAAFSSDTEKTLELMREFLSATISRKHAETTLRQSEEHFRAMFEVASIGMAQADVSSGRWVRVNQKMCQITGYSAAEMLQMQVSQITHPDDRARDWEAFQSVVSGQAPDYRMEKRYIRKNGQAAWVNVNMTVVRDANGVATRTMATVEDVSDRKRLEDQFRQAQKLEAVGQLAGGVAHDFNNILAAIEMQLSLLQMKDNLDEETLSGLKDLHGGAQRAASLTRQLLMFSRRSVLAMKALDVNDVVENLLKMLHRLIGEDVRLIFGKEQSLPQVEADAGMLEQVLMNLVVNARDAMPKGGRIDITTRLVCASTKEPPLNPEHRNGAFVCLAVSDTGCGMDTETTKRIFEPFFTTKEPGKGTGLGLATVHGIVAQHKGWVEVTSEIGKGTTFRVFLPALATPVIAEAKPAPSESLQRGHEVILLVEDETNVRRTVSKALRTLGYQVYEAENGQQAMVLWQKHGVDVDLLLTDMVMPEGLTGLELSERLQEIKPTLKVIISSGYSSEVFQAGGIKKPGIWYLPKPYAMNTLSETVRACLTGKK